MKGKLALFVLLASAFLLVGCASTGMEPVTKMGGDYRPGPGETTVIFIGKNNPLARGAISRVFDVTTDQNVFVGFVQGGRQLAHKTTPGDHLYMVIGDNGDFIRTKMAGGKTYYIEINPSIGILGPRFYFAGVQKNEQGEKGFQDRKNKLKFWEKTPKAEAKGAAGAQKVRDKYLPKWIQEKGKDSYSLLPPDGM